MKGTKKTQKNVLVNHVVLEPADTSCCFFLFKAIGRHGCNIAITTLCVFIAIKYSCVSPVMDVIIMQSKS